MEFIADILNDGSLETWRGYLHKQAKRYPDTWADSAFCGLTQYLNDIQPFCDEVFQRAALSGWGSLGPAGVSLMEAMRLNKWDVVGQILKAPVKHDLSCPDIDHLVLAGITQGVWTHLDLLRPDILLQEGNIGKIARDIFKHNENSYHEPLQENVIRQLTQLHKHEETAAIMGRVFAYTQRAPDCETDIEIPGVLASLVLMVHCGWLDLNAARAILDPNEKTPLEVIARIEKAALEQVSAMPRSVAGPRRI